MAGFFSPTETVAKARALPTIPSCGACGLYKGCKTPKMKVDGLGQKKILVIDSHPTWNDDAAGTMRRAEYFGELEIAFRRNGIGATP